MVGANVKQETMSMMEQRNALEQEMNAIIARLTAPGAPGVFGNLLDAEGFPRGDIDVMAVRTDRHRLAELRNDHNAITLKIEKNLEVLHAARVSRNLPSRSERLVGGEDSSHMDQRSVVLSNSTGRMTSEVSSSAMEEDLVLSVPFAVIDEIAEESPAAEDGMQLGDQILKFGNVESGEESLLPRLAAEAQSNQGIAVPLVIIRHGALINLSVTPRPWRGHGLLGCHFRIL